MKRLYYLALYAFCLAISGCGSDKTNDNLRFVISADYPPFEYISKGEFVGFDVELGKLIANELGKKAEFQDMQFSAILAALGNNMADAAISTITITPDRKKNFDFSLPYYVESLAILFPKGSPITDASQLPGKKIACQLGTTMEIWLKTHAKETEIITIDSNPQAVETLKAGHVAGVLIDAVQAAAFVSNNPQLDSQVIAKADTGYGIAFKKDSALTEQVNQALQALEKKGAIAKLKQKYLGIK